MGLEIAERQASWVYVVPVSGLALTSAVHEEYTVGRVTFLTVRKLSRVRRRMGLPLRVSGMRRRGHWEQLQDGGQVVAVVRRTGKPKEIDIDVQRLVTESLQILAVSQLGFSRRRRNAFPAIDGPRTLRTSHLCIDDQTGDGMMSAQLRGKLGDLVLEQGWVNHQKRVFFWEMMKMLRGELSATDSWREILRRVAVLVGQSQTSNDLAHAFLLNVIAVETLLAVQGDRYLDALPERVEAFIGWVGYWRTGDYENRIKDVYRKRCQYVHRGDASAVEITDLLFLDEIVLNVLMNIVAHPTLFKSKEDVISFASKVSAERVLGITGRQCKVRPRTLRTVVPKYSDEDLRRI